MPFFAKIKVPTLLVKGETSARIAPEIYADVKAVAPHVELVEIAGSDHHVTLDNPAAFIDAVNGFLQRN
jgi:pimeloyl-ACP methyl ester carboxylesterase